MGEAQLSHLEQAIVSHTSPPRPLLMQPSTSQLEPPSEKLFVCSACGAELPERRRAAHESLWCTHVDRPIGSSGEEDVDSDSDNSEVTENGKGSWELRARRNAGWSTCDFASNIDRNCPHDSHPEGCLHCDNASVDDTSASDTLFETPQNARRRANLSLFFLFLIVAPTCAAIFLVLLEYVNPLVLKVQPHDAERVKNIFFGRDSWVVYCVNKRIDGGTHTQMLQKAAQILRPEGVRFAEVHCWIPLPTRKGPRTLAQRFRFRDTPPVAMFVEKGARPQLLNAQDLTVDDLVRQIRQPRSDSTKRRTSSNNNGKGHKGGRRESVGRRPQDDTEIDETAETQPTVVEEVAEDEDADVVNLDA